MAIIGALPVTLTNGTIADATQVMADFNYILGQVNANAAPITGGTYLALTGGTLTGAITVQPASGSSSLTLNKPASGVGSNVLGQTGGLNRWLLQLGNGVAEPGSGNVGSDFGLSRYNDAGGVIDAPLTISRASGAVTIRGTQTNDSTGVGNVGEFVQANGISSALTTATPLTINAAAFTLTAGDWDVWGTANFTPSAQQMSAANIGISTTINVLPANLGLTALNIASMGALVLTTPTTRLSVAASTNVYLTVQANFASGTVSAIGNIFARRRR
jgi:hypothetical protein